MSRKHSACTRSASALSAARFCMRRASRSVVMFAVSLSVRASRRATLTRVNIDCDPKLVNNDNTRKHAQCWGTRATHYSATVGRVRARSFHRETLTKWLAQTVDLTSDRETRARNTEG